MLAMTLAPLDDWIRPLLAYMPLGLKETEFVLAFLCHASFAWGSVRHFNLNGRIRHYQRRMLLLTGACGLVQLHVILAMNRASLPHFVLGCGLLLSSLLLFWWSVWASGRQSLDLFFANRIPESLLAHGPYRFIRHPFYTAYSLAWVGGTVAANQPLLLLTVVLNVAIYVKAARLEERRFSQSSLAPAYRAYQRRTGMFWPRFFPSRVIPTPPQPKLNSPYPRHTGRQAVLSGAAGAQGVAEHV
jgi:protein-S-isoprenylcysteine O-methyltransferase Ste14